MCIYVNICLFVVCVCVCVCVCVVCVCVWLAILFMSSRRLSECYRNRWHGWRAII